jgi:hypothetical protein
MTVGSRGRCRCRRGWSRNRGSSDERSRVHFPETWPPAPVQAFRSPALVRRHRSPSSAARRTEEWQKLGRRHVWWSRWESELWRESSRQKDISFYREGPEPPMFRSARYLGTAPWYLSTSSHEAAARSRTCLSRSEGRRGSLGVGDVGQNKVVQKRETCRYRRKSRDKSRDTRVCACVFSTSYSITWSTLQEPPLYVGPHLHRISRWH